MSSAATKETLGAVAIVGTAGRFPGASDVDQLWRNLRDGIESVTFFTDEELAAAGVDPALVADPHYVKASARVEDADLFDAAFFGFNPREAELTDPQQRVFLECAWEALENAGCDPGRYPGSIGLFAGAGKNHYFLQNLRSNPHILEAMGPVAETVSNEKDFLATRTAYMLDLRGPCVSVQTACSTSLVAVHLACQSLLSAECDLCLAGGVSISALGKEGYVYVDGGIFSPDGHMRAFDARAAGQVGGNGAAVVVLARLEDALAQGHTIHAVIRGSALNNDGRNRVSFNAPGVEGQARAIAEALEVSGVDPDSISYVECHGTATHLGDPIEVAGLTQAFRGLGAKGVASCAIGSIKTNLGHLDAAAGATGLIKTVLALRHQAIPPSLHFEEPNPELHLEGSPFFVNAELRPWTTDGRPRRAGVSSFGMGGTNAHLIVEEAPAARPPSSSRPWQLLLVSARTASALDAATERLAEHLERRDERALADVAFTTQVGRKAFEHRRAVVCRDGAEAVRLMRALDARRTASGVLTRKTDRKRPVVFLFSGQGAQYPNMARGIYESEPTFRAEVDRCCELLLPHVGRDLRELLFPAENKADEAAFELEQTQYTQPALFVIEYALAKLWEEWGVKPDALVGHSIGEYVAACLAGVFTLEGALELVAVRGRLIGDLPAGGAMLAVHLAESEVAALVEGDLSLAAINAPGLCVVSGPLESIARLESALEKKGVATRRLHTSHAFHSALMDPILAPFGEAVARVARNAPQIPIVSCRTGTWLRDDEATDPEYWARHAREPVRFGACIDELLREPERVLLEVGPGQTLSSLARLGAAAATGTSAGDRETTIVSSTRHPQDENDDMAVLLLALGRLWTAGVGVDWEGFYARERRGRVSLPTYPFERRRFWVEPAEFRSGAGTSNLHLAKNPDRSAWFYAPSWKRSQASTSVPVDDAAWLVFTDAGGWGAALIERLKRAGHAPIAVEPGDGFARLGEDRYAIDPGRPADYEALCDALRARGFTPRSYVHLWMVDPADGSTVLDRGFYSLLFLAQALGDNESPVRLSVVTSGMLDVLGETVCPEKATVLGPCKSIAAELAQVTCRCIDVETGAGAPRADAVERLLAELRSGSPEPLVAHRGEYRWIPCPDPVRLQTPERCPARLRDEAVVLITGGLGGVGLALAEVLARAARARLVLVGRSPFPEPSAWEAWIEEHGEADGVSRRIAAIRRLEHLGAEVLVASADVTDREALRAVIAHTRTRFGGVHGVIHAAGVPGTGILQLKSREAAAAVLAPKVQGTRVLAEVLAGEELDFFVLCSSLATVLGGVGQVDYFAANAFLDAFARSEAAEHTVVQSIGWDAWQEVGMAVNTTVPEILRAGREESLRLGLSPEEGMDVFQRVLDCGLPQILVSTRDLEQRIATQTDVLAEPELRSIDVEPSATPSAHARPELSNEYEAPGNDLERRLAGLWEELLGIERVGVRDNYFELGGTSLGMMQVSLKLRSFFGVSLPIRALFETPDVASLAERVESMRLMAGAVRDGAEVSAETEEYRL